MRKGNAWKFVKTLHAFTLHVKFFPFGQKWPSRNVTVKKIEQKCSDILKKEGNPTGSLSWTEMEIKC